MSESDNVIMEKNGSRILTPSLAKKIRACLNPEYQTIFDVQLNTGLRQVEFWWLMRNQQCFSASRRLIHLPREGSCRKPKCKSRDGRVIRLTVDGARALEHAFYKRIGAEKPKAERCFGQALTRACWKAGVDPKYVNPKCLRKSMESWLVEARKDLGIDFLDILANQGHTEQVSVESYVKFVFGEEDHKDMVNFFRGWKQ